MPSPQLPPTSRSNFTIGLYTLVALVCLIGATYLGIDIIDPNPTATVVSTPTKVPPLQTPKTTGIALTQSPTASPSPTQTAYVEPLRSPTATATPSPSPSVTTLLTPTTPLSTAVPITSTLMEIRIGIVNVQRGQDNPLGIEQQIGVDLAKSYLEHKYAVNIVDAEPCSIQSDQKRLCVRFLHRTTDSGVDSAVEAFKTLIYTDSVAIIIGPTYSAQAEKAHKIAEEAGVPVIAVSNTADGIVAPEYIARVSAPVAAYAFIAWERVRAKFTIKSLIVAYQNDDPFTLSETRAFTEAITNTNLLEWSTEAYTNSMTDFGPLAQKIRQADPDLVIISARFGSGVSLIQGLRELGYSGLIIGGNGLNVNMLFEACGQACDGMYIAQTYNPTQPRTDVEREFVEEYHREGYVGLPSQITAQMFTALQLTIALFSGLDQTQLPSNPTELRNLLNQELLTMEQGIETPLGYIWLDQQGEICQNEFYIAQVQIDRNNTTGYFDILKPSFPVTNTLGKLCYSE